MAWPIRRGQCHENGAMIRAVGDPSMCAKHKEKAEGVCPRCFAEVDAERFIVIRMLAEALEFGIDGSWKKRAKEMIGERI